MLLKDIQLNFKSNYCEDVDWCLYVECFCLWIYSTFLGLYVNYLFNINRTAMNKQPKYLQKKKKFVSRIFKSIVKGG